MNVAFGTRKQFAMEFSLRINLVTLVLCAIALNAALVLANSALEQTQPRLSGMQYTPLWCIYYQNDQLRPQTDDMFIK